MLNGKAMAIPTGDIRRAETSGDLVAHDNVLESLVQGGTDVNVAVRKRRSIV